MGNLAGIGDRPQVEITSMDEDLSRIITGMISTERNRRIETVQAGLGKVMDEYTRRGALGHGRLPIDLEKVCADEYEARAGLWLGISRRVFGEADVPWTSESAEQVAKLLATELSKDWDGLLDAYRSKVAPKDKDRRFGALDTAKDRAAAHLEHEIAFSVQVQDRTRIPITEQLRAPRYAAVHDGWTKAHGLLRQTPADPSNAAKEAVSAVEQLARIVTGLPTATLGKCIKVLKESQRVQSPLLTGLEELWVWTSGEPGVRHGAGSITPMEAQYVLKLAEAALLLLLSVDV